MKKLTSFVLALAMVLCLAACSKPAESSGATDASAKATQAETKKETAPETTKATQAETKKETEAPTVPETEPEPAEKVLRVKTDNCRFLNPLDANSGESEYLDWCQARLYRRFVEDDHLTVYMRPELAESEPVDVNGDGLVWNIKIRDDAKWVDGKPITAETFEYSFRMCLDPKLVYRGGDLIGTYFTVKGAKAYYRGEVKWEEVGIKAIDGNILQVTAESAVNAETVMEEFIGYTKAPVDPEIFEANFNADKTSNTYGTSVDKCNYCGAFYVSEWIQEGNMIVLRNENYVFNNEINITRGELITVANNQTAVLMFENGELDITNCGPELRGQYLDDPRLFTYPSRTTNSMNVCSCNTDKPILQDVRLRAALWYAIDRELMARTVMASPMYYWIPDTTMVDKNGTRYCDTDVAKSYRTGNDVSFNPELANKYLDEALKAAGLEKVELSLLINSGNATQTITSQFLQEQYAKIFDGKLTLVIDEKPSSVAIAQRKSWRENPNAYEITFSSWGRAVTDFDPISCFDVLSSSYYEAVPAPFNDPVIEELIWYSTKDGTWRTDMSKNIELASRMEKSVLENFTTIPMFQQINYYLVSERTVLALSTPMPSLGLTIPAWLADIEE